MMRATLLLVLLCVPSLLTAQQTLTLGEAAAAALARHPSARVADAGVERAAAAEREAQSALLPGVMLEGSAMHFQEPMVVAPLHGFDPARPPVFDRTLVQGVAAVSWLAFDGGARRARIDRASAQADAAVATHDALREQLLADVARSYAAVVMMREVVAAHAARLSALEGERDRAVRLLDQGRVARVVLLRADAALSSARAELATARADHDNAERGLARVTGLAVDSVRAVQLAGARVVDADLVRDELLAHVRAANAELRRLESNVAAAQRAVREAESQWWPRLQLGGRYVRYASGLGDAGGEWQTGVQLMYPLFTGGSRSAAAERAHADVRLAQAELSVAELRVAAAIDEAWSAWTSAVARVAAWQAAVVQSEEVARIERLALDTGAGMQTDYLAAEAELLRARAALTQARSEQLVARVELARVTGDLTLDWIARNVESGS
jgi:outer membrane protein TolC